MKAANLGICLSVHEELEHIVLVLFFIETLRQTDWKFKLYLTKDYVMMDLIDSVLSMKVET